MREADMILMGFNSVWEAVQFWLFVFRVSSTNTFLVDGPNSVILTKKYDVPYNYV